MERKTKEVFMRPQIRSIGLILVIFVMALAACAPVGTNLPETSDGQVPSPSDTPGNLPPAAVLEAQTFLANTLNLAVDRIQIGNMEQVDWQDSCLGLGGPAESCLQAITPGWRVTFTVDGDTFEVRTDATGSTIRMAPVASGTPGDLPAAVLAAQTFLANTLNLAVDRVQVGSMEQVEWQDSCLGLGGPAESCLQAITPGWRVTFTVDGTTYEVRTDETGSTVRMAPVASADPLANTSWVLASMGQEGSETQAVEESQVTLMFEAEGQAGGSAGCNSYSSSYQVNEDSITFEAPTSTKMACEGEGIMDQETSFLQALETASRFELTETNLRIWYGDGKSVLTFNRM
jgi:heat shock protein HslJ